MLVGYITMNPRVAIDAPTVDQIVLLMIIILHHKNSG